MEEKFNIVIVDDTMTQDDPFVVRLKYDYKDVAMVTYFFQVEKALEFIDSHLSEKMVVIMDCYFNSITEGITALKSVRKKTSLVYFMMMSANILTTFRNEDIVDMINAENLFFIKNTEYEIVKQRIEYIRLQWSSRLDCVLESWMARHPERLEEKAFTYQGKYVKWQEVLSAIRKQEPLGKEMEKMFTECLIPQLQN
jgi:hypothetical protein